MAYIVELHAIDRWFSLFCHEHIPRPIYCHLTLAADQHSSDLSLNQKSTDTPRVLIFDPQDIVHQIRVIPIATTDAPRKLKRSTSCQADRCDNCKTAVPHTGVSSVDLDTAAIVNIETCCLSTKYPSNSEVR